MNAITEVRQRLDCMHGYLHSTITRLQQQLQRNLKRTARIIYGHHLPRRLRRKTK